MSQACVLLTAGAELLLSDAVVMLLQVADAMARELSVAARLKELLTSRVPPSSPEAVIVLAEAIAAAAPFSSLTADVEAARSLHQQCCQRAEAVAKLQSVIQHVVGLTSQVCLAPAADVVPNVGSSGVSPAAVDVLFQGFSAAGWERHIVLLEKTADDAKDANVSVIKVTYNIAQQDRSQRMPPYWHQQWCLA